MPFDPNEPLEVEVEVALHRYLEVTLDEMFNGEATSTLETQGAKRVHASLVALGQYVPPELRAEAYKAALRELKGIS